MRNVLTVFGIAALLTSVAAISVEAGEASRAAPNMSFFITSAGSGNGGNLGGLAGADKHCQSLAAAAGVSNRVWHAYLSADAANGATAVNAKDRIGKGPWVNYAGVTIAKDVADLHGPGNAINKQNGLTEKGGSVNGRGETPNMHDILTGSNLDGALVAGKTCNNWTSDSAGSAQLGHFDKQGGGDNPNSWNSAHPSKSCSLPDLKSTGGNGLFFCFAE